MTTKCNPFSASERGWYKSIARNTRTGYSFPVTA